MMRTNRGGSLPGSVAVALGMMVSRIAGFARQSVFAYYFGSSEAADVFNAAFRIPNVLQNLFGEGALAAALVPVYARLRASGDDEQARRVASVIATLLAALASVLVAVGVLAAPVLVSVIAPGFSGEKRDATIELVQIFFPSAGLLVLAAWCLTVLNSHRRFFLSYMAPAIWSAAIIAALLWFGRATSGIALARWVAWGAVVGSVLQLALLLPFALVLVRRLRPSFSLGSAQVREVLRNFAPAALRRGGVQISAYVDQILATFLPTGAVAALGYAQVLYMLPISLFGMAVSTAELPEMSSELGAGEEAHARLRSRLERGLGQVRFFVVPSAVLMLALGDELVALLFQRGRFGREDGLYVWAILAGAAIGVVAAASARLYASLFFSLSDTRTPFRIALVRTTLTAALAYLLALELPELLGIDQRWGAAGLTAATGIVAWVELWLLRRRLAAKIGPNKVEFRRSAKLWLAAALAALAAWLLKAGLPALTDRSWLRASVLLLVFAGVYLGVARAIGVEEARALLRRLSLARGRKDSL